MNQETPAASAVEDYYLVAGEIIFGHKDAEEVFTFRLNTVLTTKDGRISAAHLARAQQSLQMLFHKRMAEPTIMVKDLTILALMHLGKFTAEEFNKAPPGMKLHERTQEVGNA